MKPRQMDADYLRGKINIDRDALHEGIEEQPGLFFAAADALALAFSVRDQAKTEMDNEYSRACGRAREQKDEDGKKPTEGAIKEAAQLDKKYLAAEAAYRKAKLDAETAVALRDSFEMRAKMLREMSQLFLAGYFQASSVGGVRKGVDDKAAEIAREGLHRARLGSMKRGGV